MVWAVNGDGGLVGDTFPTPRIHPFSSFTHLCVPHSGSHLWFVVSVKEVEVHTAHDCLGALDLDDPVGQVKVNDLDRGGADSCPTIFMYDHQSNNAPSPHAHLSNHTIILVPLVQLPDGLLEALQVERLATHAAE